MNIAGISIKRPVMIVMMVASIITLGVIGYGKLPVDLLPNVEFPNVVVFTEYPGASADEIETLITKPLENALGTVEGLDTLTSTSREGQSVVSVSFVMGTDIKYAELKVREKVQAAMGRLPDGIEQPVMRRFSSDDMPIATLAIQGDRDPTILREILENDIQPRLEALEGVGSISVSGGRKRIIRIAVDKGLLAANGISFSQISSAVTKRNISYPVGEIAGDAKNINVRVFGKAASADDIGDITFSSPSGKILRIRDVAKVETTLEDEDRRVRVNGKESVIFDVYKQSGGNTVKTVDAILNGLPKIQESLPRDMKVVMVRDTSQPIRRSIKGVQEDIILGAFLAICIVWLFLGNMRSTLITAVALPNSLLGAFFLVNLAGFSLNTMTLLSLSLAVGLLIDDSIVVRENIFRYIEHGLDPKTAAEKGTNEVALAVLSTTAAILAVFIPISFLTGVIGQFFREFGLTVAFALLISLLDAFTTAPMLSAYWFKHTNAAVRTGVRGFFGRLSGRWNIFYDRINALYTDALLWSLNHKKILLGSVLILFVFSFYISGFIGKNFMSASDSGQFSVNFETYPGAPINTIDACAKDIENFLSRKQEVKTFFSVVGHDGSHAGRISVELIDFKKRSVSTQDVMNDTRKFIRAKYERDITFRLNEDTSNGMRFGGGGGGGAVLINVTGPDLKTLENLSRDIYKTVSETPGTSDPSTTLKPGAPELVIMLDSVKAEKMGINAADLGVTLRALVQGSTISTLNKDNRDYNIVIRLAEKDRRSAEDIRNMMITAKNGSRIPLSAVCTFEYGSAPLEIRRESKQRIVRVSANLAKGYALTDVTTKVKKAINEKVKIPDGYSWSFGGQQKQFADLGSQMAGAMVLALLFMYMILASLYNSFIQPLILMLSIPLAVIGAFIALILTGVDLDIYGYIGLLLVLGLVAKNAILLIDFTNRMRDEGMQIRDALLHAGPVRLRPILMTSFAMIFGMLPLALGLNEGSRGRQALPVAVIGGILTSTFLTLVVVPVVYEWVEMKLERRRIAAPSAVVPAEEAAPVKKTKKAAKTRK